MERRKVLKAVVAAGASSLGAVASAGDAAPAPSVYARLGVKPLINGMGTVTVVGGSLMPPEVVRAMEEASRHFVFVPDLQKKAGARIAELVGVPGGDGHRRGGLRDHGGHGGGHDPRRRAEDRAAAGPDRPARSR